MNGLQNIREDRPDYEVRKPVNLRAVRQLPAGEETVEAPSSVRTVGELAAWLGARGGGYADAFADLKRVRAAVNKEHGDFSVAVKAGDEVACEIEGLGRLVNRIVGDDVFGRAASQAALANAREGR